MDVRQPNTADTECPGNPKINGNVYAIPGRMSLCRDFIGVKGQRLVFTFASADTCVPVFTSVWYVRAGV